MEVSIVGYSSLIERKILHAFNEINSIEKVNIFSRRNLNREEFKFFNFQVRTFPVNQLDNYSKNCNSFFYYISTENSSHDFYTYLLLSNFKNVLIDKPISLSEVELNRNLDLAKKNGCFISEVLTWDYHSQVNYLKGFIKKNQVSDVLIRFTIPMPMANNFRINNSRGSGVFWDMVTYFLSTANLFDFEPNYITTFSKGIGSNCNQWFKIDLISTDLRLNSLFGFGFPYQNKLELISQDSVLNFNRIFTSDPKEPVKVKKINKQNSEEILFKDNSFLNYFKFVIDLIVREKYEGEFIKIRDRYNKLFKLQKYYYE